MLNNYFACADHFYQNTQIGIGKQQKNSSFDKIFESDIFKEFIQQWGDAKPTSTTSLSMKLKSSITPP